MTFILSVANDKYAIHVSDRRLQSDGATVDEYETKATVWWAADAKLVCGFTGLAGTTGFRASRWLGEALCKASEDDCLAGNVLTRFVDIATAKFREPPISGLARRDRRFTVMFTGFHYAWDPPLPVSAMVTNFQDFDSGRDAPEAWDEFRPWFFKARRPVPEVPTHVQRIGAWGATTSTELDSLRCMLERRLPAEDVVEKAVGVVREIAARPLAADAIGPHLMSVVLNSDAGSMPATVYHSGENTHVIPFANGVFGPAPGRTFAFADLTLRADDPSKAPPMAVPRIARNRPCPCGSRKKYKLCHGQKRQDDHGIRIGFQIGEDETRSRRGTARDARVPEGSQLRRDGQQQ